jgi:hypothetical protein
MKFIVEIVILLLPHGRTRAILSHILKTVKR